MQRRLSDIFIKKTALLMLQISTQDHYHLLLENLEESTSSLSQNDESFYNSIKPELNKEIREPHASTIERIMAYSKNHKKDI